MKVIFTLILSLFITLAFQVNAEKVTFMHPDALGSPVAATDEGGNVIWTEHYNPYGGKVEDDSAANTNSIGFTGHEFDSKTGLTYMQARYYDPVIGRFYSNDPVDAVAHLGRQGGIHGFNRYAYANNNPYKYTDPDGRETRLMVEAEHLDMDVANGNMTAQQRVDISGAQVTGAISGLPGGAAAAKLAKPLAKLTRKIASKIKGNPKTPNGRELSEHALERMVDPPKGRSSMTPSDVDNVLDNATKVQKRTAHPQGDTLTIVNKNMPGKPKVVVDAATGNKVVTVIKH